MIKRLIQFLLVILGISFFIIFYLSYFGIETKRFNNKIKEEILKDNQTLDIDLKSVKFLLKPSNLSVNVKTFEPNIFFNNQQFKLEYIKTNISLKSFINNKFSVDDLKISTKEIKLNNIIQLARSFNNSTELFILNKVIKKGFLVADINLNFDDNGKIKDDFLVNGIIKNGSLGLLNKNNINNLNLLFKVKKNEYLLEDINATFNQIKLTSPLIKIIEQKNIFLIQAKIITNEKNFDKELFKDLLGNNFKELDIENINFSSENNLNFNISKKLKISNLKLKSKISLNTLDYKNELLNIKKYLPNFQETIKLQDHKILLNYKKNQLDINGNGKLIIEDKIDSLNYKIRKKNDEYNFKTNIDLNKNSLLIDILNYKKKENLSSILKLSGKYKKDKHINFNSILLNEDQNSFFINNLKLDNEFKIFDIDSVDLNYINQDQIQNNIRLKKNKKDYQIDGDTFDATNFIEGLLKDNDDDKDFSIFKNLNSNINIKIKKTYIDTLTYLENFSGSIRYIDNKINKLNLDAKFSNNKKIKITINTNDDNEKITTLFSSYPKPILKRYKFIKGFEEGVLDFYSIKKNDHSKSVLIIDDFKVQEVPVLAKLLTLASLQGIADLLTGEGIRFTDLEMKFSNQKGLMKIEEMYAIGPAISILMDGYIERKKLISLRGTLVPATTINRSIASIPLIGKILVGEKTGEGVFGVSFKIKGPPKNLKTTVNPVKTLTPRFITRTLEKLKTN